MLSSDTYSLSNGQVFMSEEENQEEPQEQEGDPLEELAERTTWQWRLIFGSVLSSVVFMGSLAFTYATLNGRIVTLTTEPLMEMKNLSGSVSEEYESLNLAVEFHNHLLESMQDQLDAIDPTIDQEQFDNLQQVMVGQEQDFQAFLGSVKLAVSGLSEMMSGSRTWREDFYTKLDAAIATSEQREMNFMDQGLISGPAEMAAVENPE